MPHFKKLNEKQKQEIEQQIKKLLHASRDAMRNRHRGLEEKAFDARHDPALSASDLNKFHEACKAIDAINRLRDQADPKRYRFDVNNGWYGEAFGILHSLRILGYGDMYGAYKAKDYHNLRWWFQQLEDQVLVEDGYIDGTHRCDVCVRLYGKDGAGRTRQTHPEIANAKV